MLRAFLSDEQKRLETGERARNFALNAYRLDILLPRYLELFDRLIQA
jgi:hypothetical protein